MIGITDKHNDEEDKIDPAEGIHIGVLKRLRVWPRASDRLLLQGPPQNPKHVKEGTAYHKSTNGSDNLVNHWKPSSALIDAVILR